jgi:hypothetical protein
MSSLALRWYDVKVKVRQRNSRYIIRTCRIEAKSDDKARERARKYGEPLTAYKVDWDTSGIERLKLNQAPLETISPAIAMDEMIWQKRNNRRENLFKDKPPD